MAAIESKVNTNFLLLTDSNSKLEAHVSSNISRIDSDIMEIVNNNTERSKREDELESEIERLQEKIVSSNVS